MRSRFRTIMLTMMTIMLLVAPFAAARPAPEPRGQEVRLLHDHEDDWGRSTSTEDGHDLVALDLRETYDPETGEAHLVFRLIMAGGYARFSLDDTEVLRETIAFQADGVNMSFEITTEDNEAFNGTFDAVEGPLVVMRADGAPDAGRFAVEGTLVTADHGLEVGTNLTGFTVQGRADNDTADDMGIEPASGIAAYAPEYIVQGPVMYATLDTSLDALHTSIGAQESVEVEVTNLLNDTQEAWLSVSTAADLAMSLENGTDAGANGTGAEPEGDGTGDDDTTSDNATSGDDAANDTTDTPEDTAAEGPTGMNVTLGPQETVTITLRLAADGPVDDAVVDLGLVTDLGGHAVGTLRFSASEAPPPPSDDGHDADADTDADPVEDRGDRSRRATGQEDGFDVDVRGGGDEQAAQTPAPGMALTAVAVVGVALVVRDRRRRA